MKKFSRTHILRAHNNRADIEDDYIRYSTIGMTNGEQEYYKSKQRENKMRMNILLFVSLMFFGLGFIALVKWWF